MYAAVPPALKALISDIGGVVVRVDAAPLRRFIAERSGLPEEVSWPRFHDHPAWRDCEAGRTDLAGVACAVETMFGVSFANAKDGSDELARAWCDVFPGLVDGMPELYAEVRAAGLRLLALSNTIPAHMEYLARRFGLSSRSLERPARLRRASATTARQPSLRRTAGQRVLQAKAGEMSMFERVYTSYEIGARKPARAAFDYVLDDAGLAAAECVYVDDLPENVAAARELGMRAILARGTESVREGLAALGIP